MNWKMTGPVCLRGRHTPLFQVIPGESSRGVEGYRVGWGHTAAGLCVHHSALNHVHNCGQWLVVPCPLILRCLRFLWCPSLGRLADRMCAPRQEKIAAIELEMARTQKNKATEVQIHAYQALTLREGKPEWGWLAKVLELCRTLTLPALLTQGHLGILKAKIAKLRTQLLEPASGGAKAGEGFDVVKYGDSRVAIIGFPSVRPRRTSGHDRYAPSLFPSSPDASLVRTGGKVDSAGAANWDRV